MPSRPAAQRVLLYRLGSLGDHLVALPCFHLVARMFPDAERRLLTNIPVASKAAAAEAVLGGSSLVHGFETYVVGERGILPLLRLARRIRSWKPDVLVYLAGARGVKAARRDRLFFQLCGIRRQIGLPLTDDLQRNRTVEPRNGVAWREHEGERLARTLAPLGDARTPDRASWSPLLTEAERAEAARLLAAVPGPFFVFSIGTKAQSNHWGVDRWSEFFRRLAAEHPGHALVLLGAPDEAAVSNEVASAWNAADGVAPALNLCGASSPRVSAAVMQRARMFFGHDSGPAHLAASVNTPVLGVYSARMQPGEWVPFGPHVRVIMHWVECGGCLLETCIERGKKCILSVSVEEALAAAREHLAATANGAVPSRAEASASIRNLAHQLPTVPLDVH